MRETQWGRWRFVPWKRLRELRKLTIAILQFMITVAWNVPAPSLALLYGDETHETHYNILQHTATHCTTLQRTATRSQATSFSARKHTATHCNTLQRHLMVPIVRFVARDAWPGQTTLCNTLQHFAIYRSTLQHTVTNTLQSTATLCNTLQHSAALCDILQYSATHCNTLHHASSSLVCSSQCGETKRLT